MRRSSRHAPGPSGRRLLGVHLAGATARAVAFGLFMLAGALGVGHLGLTWSDTPARFERSPDTARLDEVERLVVRHRCWTRTAPPDMTGQVPGHAVVTLPGRDMPSYVGPTWTGRALERIFEGSHEDGREDLAVHAFCR